LPIAKTVIEATILLIMLLHGEILPPLVIVQYSADVGLEGSLL
jgi:hypothetical protein